MLHVLLAGWIGAAAAGEARHLTWAEALAQLDTQSPDLEQVRARLGEAQALHRLAAAALLPSASVAGAYTHNNEEVILSFSGLLDALPASVDTSGFPTDRTLQPLNAWTASGQLTVPLVVPSAYAERAAAWDGVQAAEQATSAARSQLAAGVLVASAGVQRADGIAQAAERAVERAQAHRDAAARAVTAETQPPLALLQAETELARRKGELNTARAQLSRAQRALGVLLGTADPVVVELPTEDISAGSAETTAEVRAAQSQAEAAAHREQAAKLRMLPMLSANVKGTTSSVELITGDQYMWSAGVEARWSLLEGGARAARQDQAAAQRRGAEAALAAADLRATQAARDAEADLTLAEESLALARERLSLAQAADAVAQRGLSAGTTAALDAQDAAEQVFQADVAVVVAQAAVIAARAELARARGVSW